MEKAYKVLIADLIGLRFDANGVPDHSAVKSYIEGQGHTFHEGLADNSDYPDGIHFFYQPNLSREDEILPITEDGQYDALIAAATFIPAASKFAEGGVRIGAGTGNMGASSWGGGNGDGGEAPLMNTPSFNSRATAQMAMKALLKVLPDLDVETLHARTCMGDFDTGKNLAEFPTEKIEGKTIAVIGYGNIGREVAKIASAFGMKVRIYARPHHQQWIESEGFTYAPTILDAATGADALSPHTGLGALDAETGIFANAELVISETEVGFWGDAGMMAQAPAEAQGLFQFAQTVFSAYADRTRMVGDGAEVAPGMTLHLAPGHTPGHSVLAIDGGDRQLMMVADAVHNSVLHLALPDIGFGFDIDSGIAAASRRALFDQVSADNMLVAGSHLPFPGFGRIVTSGDAYAYVPTHWM